MTSDKVMSKLQKVDNFMQKPGEPDAGPDAANAAIANEESTKGINGINDQAAKEFYIKQKLSAVIVPFYNEAVSVAQAAMWNVLDFIKSVAETSLMGLVGAIPFVGGVLSAIVAIVFDAIWVMFEHHVNAAFLNLANVVIDKVLDAMVKPIVAELKTTKGPVKTIKAADKKALAAQQSSPQGAVTGPAQKNLEAEWPGLEDSPKNVTDPPNGFRCSVPAWPLSLAMMLFWSTTMLAFALPAPIITAPLDFSVASSAGTTWKVVSGLWVPTPINPLGVTVRCAFEKPATSMLAAPAGAA